MRAWIEGSVFKFYSFSIFFGPAALGYICGRWLPIYFRILPLLFIIPAGIWWVLHSDHEFEFYVLGNLYYLSFCIMGLKRRAKVEKIGFWRLHHWDWIALAFATLIMIFTYTLPTQ